VIEIIISHNIQLILKFDLFERMWVLWNAMEHAVIFF